MDAMMSIIGARYRLGHCVQVALVTLSVIAISLNYQSIDKIKRRSKISLR